MRITTFFVDKVSEFRAPTAVDSSTGRGTPACFSKVALAHVGYIVCIPFAAVETAILLIARVFSLIPGMNANFVAWSQRELELSATTLSIASCAGFLQGYFNDVPISNVQDLVNIDRNTPGLHPLMKLMKA